MGVPVTFLSANTRSALGNTITDLIPSETYLVVPWAEISGSLMANSPTPDTLEDWIAALLYRLVDRTLADTNTQTGAKLTAGRRFVGEINGRGLDNGIFEPGQDLIAYQLTTTIYSPSLSPTRPNPSSL